MHFISNRTDNRLTQSFTASIAYYQHFYTAKLRLIEFLCKWHISGINVPTITPTANWNTIYYESQSPMPSHIPGAGIGGVGDGAMVSAMVRFLGSRLAVTWSKKNH